MVQLSLDVTIQSQEIISLVRNSATLYETANRVGLTFVTAAMCVLMRRAVFVLSDMRTQVCH